MEVPKLSDSDVIPPKESTSLELDVKEVQKRGQEIISEVQRLIVGKSDILYDILIALLAKGHVVLEGVPGLAKTYMANTFAKILGCAFKRIQMTVDTLPADIVGSNVYNQATGEFWFREGPVFANIVLADEINRAPPKTQSALLEVMEEKQVSIEGVTRKLPKPFIVIATMNPVEQEGTYPLPEAQLDRFMYRLILDYPKPEEEVEILRRKDMGERLSVRVLANPDIIIAMQKTVENVFIDDDVKEYIRDLIIRTRNDAQIILGGSPRASIVLMNGGKAHAALEGRDYVIPEDIRALAVQALNHRLILKPEAELEGMTVRKVIERIIREIDVPK